LLTRALNMLRFVFSLSLLLTVSCGGRIDVDPEASPPTSGAEGGSDSESSPSVDFDAPPRTKKQVDEASARAACRACRGDWGRHGLSPEEGCNCRTEDFGASCADNSECEGQCLADAPGEMMVDPGPPRRGFFVGQCSEFRASFGCHAVLADGFNLGEPVLLDEGVPMRCLD
jgi:hypothetical protein